MYVATRSGPWTDPQTGASTNEAACADLSRYSVFDTVTQDSFVPSGPEVRCQLPHA